MKLSHILTVCAIFSTTVFSCKKDLPTNEINNDDPKRITAIAEKYGLTKAEQSVAADKRFNFKTIEEFEAFFAKREALMKQYKKSKGSNSIMNSDAIEFDFEQQPYGTGGGNDGMLLFRFDEFSNWQFPELVQAQTLSPYAHNLMYSGFNFGQWTYVPLSGGTGPSLESWQYTGNYTEFYGFGAFSYTRPFGFRLEVNKVNMGRYAGKASFTPY